MTVFDIGLMAAANSWLQNGGDFSPSWDTSVSDTSTSFASSTKDTSKDTSKGTSKGTSNDAKVSNTESENRQCCPYLSCNISCNVNDYFATCE